MTSIEELKARKAWLLRVIAKIDKELEKQLRESTRPAKPKTQPLPGVPEHQRQPSESEEDFDEFQRRRAAKIQAAGGPPVEDRLRNGDPIPRVFINTAFKRLRGSVTDRDELWWCFVAFFGDEYWSKYSFPFEAFVSTKVFPRLLERVRAERREGAH